MNLMLQVCLVTGGTSGLGADATVHLAGEGCKVVFTGRREDKGNALAAAIKASGGEATFVKADGKSGGDVSRTCPLRHPTDAFLSHHQ
jgi:NAD(P)-dependent dehydrogenase (short-subunit alcohol dehydrogenase family)